MSLNPIPEPSLSLPRSPGASTGGTPGQGGCATPHAGYSALHFLGLAGAAHSVTAGAASKVPSSIFNAAMYGSLTVNDHNKALAAKIAMDEMLSGRKFPNFVAQVGRCNHLVPAYLRPQLECHRMDGWPTHTSLGPSLLSMQRASPLIIIIMQLTWKGQ